MSQTKAQLIQPVGVVTAGGVVVTGVVTASSFTGDVVGSATSIISGGNLNLGDVNATTFSGDFTGTATGINTGADIKVGQFTASSFTGDFTGTATSMFRGTGFKAGAVNATGFHVSGSSSGDITGNVTGNATGLAGGLGVNYNGGWTGAGTSQINAGVVTATTFYGDGQYLDGVSSGPVSQQSIGITSAATTIDLSNGNLIFATQSASTTVSFANTTNGSVYFVRTKDDTTTARTITWPDSFNWDGGTEPTLSTSEGADDAQVLLLITRNMGVAWYGKEVFNFMGQGEDLFTWGYDNNGAGGRNTRGEISSPVQVGGTGWNYVFQMTNGANHNFYSKLDGSLWSAGYNNRGNLGLNDITQRSSPTQIGTDTNWTKSGVISRHSPKVLKTDGTLWSFGGNGHGNLGLNQTSNLKLSSPTQIPGTTWSSAVGLGSRTLALKTNGTLWSWGYNEYGQCGQNDTIRKSSPTQVGTDTTWSKLPVSGGEGGRAGSAAIKTNGTLWVWGSNYFAGKLGLNTRTDVYSSPIQVGTNTNWANVATGDKSTMATKTDGTLWMMGDNERGALGQNNLVYYSSPVQIPGTNWHLTNFRPMGNSEGTLAMKQDGTLWAWGNPSSGRSGRNESINRSSPAQVPGTWSSIGGGSAISGLKP